MRLRQLVVPLVAAALALSLAGCVLVDRDSLRVRRDGLARELYAVPGVLDVVLDDAIEPNVNGVMVDVRLDYDRGREAVVDDLAAVRQKLDDGDFDKFRLTATIDDSLALPWGADITFSPLPTDAELREQATLWFDLIEAMPVTSLTYDYRPGDSPEVFVTAFAAVRSDGSLPTDDELADAITGVWVASGRDSAELVVNP
jgi:hypothetical protein